MVVAKSRAPNTLFIITTPSKQSVEDKRKLIRSHVMRGKNNKRLPQKPPSWIDCHQEIVLPYAAFTVPPRVGGELSFMPCSAEISSDLLETVWKLKQAMSTLSFGLASNLALASSEQSWFEPIWNDAACLHFTIYIARLYVNFVKGQQETSQIALSHLIKALTILQQRLSSNDSYQSTSESTILVIVGLTTAATIFGDFETAIKHIHGLHRIVTMRGGVSSLNGNKQLQTKIFRADLGVALATGHKPLFFSENINWNSYIASRGRITIAGAPVEKTDSQVPSLERFHKNLDERLLMIWDDVAEVTRAANIAAQCQQKIDGDMFREAMVSIHYRLANLGFEAGTTDELVRLALLAFSSTLFLQWHGIKTHYEHLARNLKEAVVSLTPPQQAEALSNEFFLWTYIIMAISIFDGQDRLWLQPFLSEILRTMELQSWEEVKAAVRPVLWVDTMHDPRARQLIEATLPTACLLFK